MTLPQTTRRRRRENCGRDRNGQHQKEQTRPRPNSVGIADRWRIGRISERRHDNYDYEASQRQHFETIIPP